MHDRNMNNVNINAVISTMTLHITQIRQLLTMNSVYEMWYDNSYTRIHLSLIKIQVH